MNLGIGLLIKVTLFLEEKLLCNTDLLRLFLESVLIVFENEYFKDMTDTLSKLSVAFYWGMCCRNSNIRFRYLKFNIRFNLKYLSKNLLYFIYINNLGVLMF